ncbi:transglutaminaseTgpA domain-containing protein [Sorangium sp. So ce124]|uniref:transglutaminase family protein n=1 Tax=Sorangium sp. So ce124 TaxID=3133280 RepID=UPI003F603602
MRFGMVHRVMTDALAALGVIALVASGQFNRYVSWAILISLGLALVVRESWQRRPALRHLDTGILLVVIAVQVVRIVATDASVLDVLVEFAAALQIIRLATRKGAAHDQQVIVLALLHLIAGTVLGGGMGYGLCFLGVLVVAPGALVLSHLRREVEGNYRQGARDRTGLPVDVPRILRSRRVVGRSFLAVTCLLSVPIFVFTALLFVIFPRVGLSLLLLNRGHTGRMIGFSGKVDLGAVGVLRSDPKLAMRVEIPELPEPPPPRLTMHLRGTALDAYDGRTWTQSETFKRPTESDGGLVPIERYPDPAVDPVMRIDLEPIDPPVIFLPPNATGLRLKHRGQLGVDANAMAQRGPEGELRYQPTDDRGLVYDVFLSRKRAPTFQRLPAAERRRYLDLPRDLPSRVVELAQQWTQGVDRPADRARAIQEHLRTEYRYDLASPSGADPQPLDHFLFESKRGHCEFYSTAMAILLRAVDVPTRNVTGFVGGTYNRFGRFYAVRQGDAHSWVEVYLDGEGWMTFDPTPPADAAPKSELVGAWAYLRDFIEATSQRWDRHVVGYDLNQQVGLLQTLTSRYRRSGSSSDLSLSRPRILAVAAVALALGGGLLYWRFRRTRRGREERRADAGRTPSAILATALYESLEAAMLVQGVPRPPSLPPLRHAEALELADHPLAREILTLTQVYLRARFGGATLTEDDSRDFERRVKALRSTERRARAASDSGLAASP